MPFLSEIALALSVIAVVFSVLANQKAGDKFQSAKVVKKVRELDSEVTFLGDQVEKFSALVRRKISRDNMAKAREKRHEKGNQQMSDEEWRKYANKRINQGLPVE